LPPRPKNRSLALFATHGIDLALWPVAVRKALAI